MFAYIIPTNLMERSPEKRKKLVPLMNKLFPRLNTSSTVHNINNTIYFNKQFIESDNKIYSFKILETTVLELEKKALADLDSFC